METEYIEDINQWVQAQEESNAAKKREFLFSSINTPRQSQDNNQSDEKKPHKKFDLISKAFSYATKSKSNSFITKSIRKLVDQLDTIVDLLQKN